MSIECLKMIPMSIFEGKQWTLSMCAKGETLKEILSTTDTKSGSQENQCNRLKVFVAWTDRLKV